jgi:hypothetical protein
LSDAQNCGACGHACAQAMGCVAGQCSCGAPLVNCGGACIDVTTSTANCGACGHACPMNGVCSAGQCATPTSLRYVLNSLTLPMQRSDYAIDLNGDGRSDNQLGNIDGALSAQNFDIQTAESASIAAGNPIYLIELRTVDATGANDPAATVKVSRGLTANGGTPDFGGMGSYTIDATVPASTFSGALANHRYGSESPVTTHAPVTLAFRFAFFGAPIEIALNGAHIQFVTGTDMASGAPGLINGEIQGSIKESDVQNVLIPQIATLLNARIAANPTSPTSMMLLQLFDTGNGAGGTCTSADGTVGTPGDGLIAPCEVAMNNIIQNVLAPDVQIYDANGNYAPNSQNTMRDSLSVGVAFTAVRATF